MAEDLNLDMTQMPESNALQQSVDVGAIDTDVELNNALQEAQMDVPSFDMNAIVNGPPQRQNFGEPSAPQRPSGNPPSDFKKSMESVIDASINENYVDKYAPAPGELVPVGPKIKYAGKDVDLYRYQEDFDPKGFDPFNEKNYEHWTGKETWSSALGKGLDSFATRFGNTYVDSFASYGRIGEALFNWDWSRLMPTEQEMMEQNWEEHKESMKNFVFVPPEEEEDIISKRTVSEFIGNAGFALGTFGALATELVADAALTFVTGGGGAASFGATATRFAGKEGVKLGLKETVKKGAFKFADFMVDVGKGATHFANQSADALSASAKIGQKTAQAEKLANAGKIGSDALRNSMKEVFDIYTLNARNIVKSRSFGELATNLAKGVPLVGTGIRYGEKIAAGVKGGLSTGKLVGIGLQGTRRIVQEYNMASTEAGFEAVTSYGATLDLMVDNHRRENNGENPSPEQFAKMQSKAMESATSNYNTNVGILLATNRLQFGAYFNKYIGASKFTKELLEEGAEKTLGVNRMFKSTNLLGKVYQKGFFGTYGLLGKISKDFGRKQAVYQFGKAFLKDVGRFEVTEGLQENIQETSAEAWKYYYAGQYNGTKYTLSQAFEKGLDDQFTKQGLRTFLQGALTGSIIRPATHITSTLTNYINEKAIASNYKNNPNENPIVQMKEQLKRDMDLQNRMMQQMSNKKFEDNIVAFTTQVDASLQQTEAAARNDQYEWQNAKDNKVISAAMAANRSGTSLVFEQALREMGKTMTNEEFEKAFNVKLSDTKYKTAAEFTAEMANDVKKYSDTIDGIRRKVKNDLVDPLMYERGSKDRLIATILHNAQEEAIKIIALNSLKGTRAAERTASISQELLSIPGFANSAEYAMRILANTDNIKPEVGNIQSELRILQESLQSVDPEQKAIIQEKIKDKKRELEIIDKWLGYWGSRDVTLEREDAETKEKGEKVETVYEVFKGVPFKAKEVDEKGNLTNKEVTLYSLDHEEISSLLSEFINLRNKQAGINTQISNQDLRDSVNKLIDYIRLDQDAKDYMRAMDTLFNPDYYKQTINRIQDGRFKYELLEFVDNLQKDVRQLLMFAIANTDQNDINRQAEVFDIVSQSLQKSVFESEAYKNLVMTAIEPVMGTEQLEFVRKNADTLNQILQDEIAKVIQQFAPDKGYNEIPDESYEIFLKTKTVSGQVLSTLALRVKKGETLTQRQKEVYDANKDKVDAIIERINEITSTEAKYQSQDDSIVGIAKQKLIDTKEFTAADLDLLTSGQILDLALEKNLITPEDILKHKKTSEPITDEIYNAFVTTQDVPQNILEIIARKDLDGIELSEREERILEAKAGEIQTIQDEIEAAEKNAVDASTGEDVTATPEELTKDIKPEDTSSDEIVTGETINPVPKPEDADALNAFLIANAGEDINDDAEPFEKKGDSITGFDVQSKDGINVNDEKIKNEKDADELADKLNNARKDIDWATDFMGDLSKEEEPMLLLDKMVNRGKQSLAIYNKNKENKIPNLEEYYKIPEGKEALDAIRESVLTNTPLSQVKAKRKQEKKAAGTQIDLFDVTGNTQEGIAGPALTMDSFQKLDTEIKRMLGLSGTPVSVDVKLESTDKIIWGHPTIGKSYLKKQGENRFITLDDDYADEVNAFVDANRGSETRQEYKGRKPKEYNEFMLSLYDRLKAQAKKEGKILFVSNTNILKERMSDFDKVINIPEEEFKKRFDARGAKYGFKDWKSDIDATISKVPVNKVINTTGYLSDLLPAAFTDTKVALEIADVKITPAEILPNTRYTGTVNGRPATISVGTIITKGQYKGNANVNVTYSDGVGGFGGNSTIAEIANWINTKSSTVNLENAEKNGKFVSEDTVTEESILDDIRKLSTCFK